MGRREDGLSKAELRVRTLTYEVGFHIFSHQICERGKRKNKTKRKQNDKEKEKTEPNNVGGRSG